VSISASLTAPAGPVIISRDGSGIPHVSAQSAGDAWFGMGYACAGDRLFQLDYDRRRACGRWSEIAGPAAVSADILARRLGLAAAARADVVAMSQTTRLAFERYAAGVNAAIADGARPSPATYPVEKWEAWQSVAAFKIRHVLMGQWQHKLAAAALLARVGPAAFSQLETRPPLGSPVSVPPRGRVQLLVDDALADISGHLGFLAEAEPGSNAWAVSGKRTAHGGAVICNDSHRYLDAPNVYWQCRVTCPEFEATGATFPGLPGFPHFGFNTHVAWAITHADADNQDLYLEQFDGGRYLTPDGWADADRRTEVIEVRGNDPVETTVWQTRHGPVVHGDPRRGLVLALQYIPAMRPDRGFECLGRMLAARDVTEMADAQDGWVDPINNLVCADTSGRIAYQARGQLPVRSSPAHRRLPVPGWDGSCEWTGVVPFEQMPRSIDPDAGFVLTANNTMIDGDEPYTAYSFTQPFRAERIREHLSVPGSLTAGDLAGMQADTVSFAALGWTRLLARPDVTAGLHGPASLAGQMLAAWDGNLTAESAEALLYGCFQRALAEALYRPVVGPDAWEWVISGILGSTIGLVRRWLGNDTWELLGGPVPERSDDSRSRRVLAVLPAVLARAWAAAIAMAGPDPAHWRWGEVHQAGAAHPLSSSGSLGPVPMGGDADTIQAAGYGWRPGTPFSVLNLSVYRQVVDLADPAAASFVIPGGSSGDPASPHFADQLAVWAQLQRVPMLGPEA
jgi:penicillin G amidase